MPPLTDAERTWLDGLAPFDKDNQLAFLAILCCFGFPTGHMDIGCGSGAMVRIARTLGIESFGVDQLPHAEPWLIQANLENPFDYGRNFDLVTSIEVAEHISPENADTFCDTLERHVNGGGLLVLTTAAPGQKGAGHVNCQPQLYWQEKLEKRGLRYRLEATAKLAIAWEHTWMRMHWLEKNLQVFSR